MTIDEAISEFKERAEDSKKISELGLKSYIPKAKEEEQIAKRLEELKAIKEIDLDIPQHFTKEQSDWIKTYCIKRNIEFYNKAIDDFVKLVHKHDWNIRNINENSFIYGAIDTLAEQLKEGVENEYGSREVCGLSD